MNSAIGRIYVTGAAGMIGSNLCQALLQDGHSVVGIDNLWRGAVRSIDQLKAHPNFEFRHADIIADEDWFADLGSDSATPVSDDHGTDNAFTGRVRWVQIDLDEAAEDLDHLITPEDRMRIAMARQ